MSDPHRGSQPSVPHNHAMNRRPRIVITIFASVLVVLGGCDDSRPPQPPPVEETVFGDTVGTLDRARAVEDVTRQRTQALDQALEGAATDAAGRGP